MSYRLISNRELYKEDIPNVMRPFTARIILQNAFCCSLTTIFNLNKFVSPFGNKEMQQKKLIQDIESGRVMLVALASEFGTLGTANTSYNGAGGFDSSIQQIKQYGKKRPTMGGSFRAPEEDNDFSTLEFVAGATVGVASAVGDEIRSTLEFAADLAGSAVYDYTGFKGAKAAHQRTEKRVDALIEQTKHLDDLLDDIGHVITHPSETYNAIKNKANDQLDAYDDLIDSGKNYQAGLLAGAVVKEVGEALLDTPLTKVKKLAKFGKIISNKGIYNPHAWRKHLKDMNPGHVVTSTTVPPPNMRNVKWAGKMEPESKIVYNNRGFPIFDDIAAYDTTLDFESLEIKNNYAGQMRAATRELRSAINQDHVLANKFTEAQLKDITSGKAKIHELTWHHHENQGRMQLVPEPKHNGAAHIGGQGLKNGK